jgi:hypothetical protein
MAEDMTDTSGWIRPFRESSGRNVLLGNILRRRLQTGGRRQIARIQGRQK